LEVHESRRFHANGPRGLHVLRDEAKKRGELGKGIFIRFFPASFTMNDKSWIEVLRQMDTEKIGYRGVVNNSSMFICHTTNLALSDCSWSMFGPEISIARRRQAVLYDEA
jgi:hypothetical protein